MENHSEGVTNAASADDLIRMALKEDIGSGDATTQSVIDAGSRATGRMVARQSMVVCGVEVVRRVYQLLDPECGVEVDQTDGGQVEAGTTILTITGPARSVLTGERVALNFIQRLSGIATLTHHYSQAIEGTPTRLLDTRKTTPGWRHLEKYAVKCGGGTNHRSGLHDMVMIKDNHLATLRGSHPGESAIAVAVSKARQSYPDLQIEVEADELGQVREALEAGADIILLDNMSLAELREAVSLCRGRARTEASGGINLTTIRDVAETGPDFISVGALTHSAANVDIGLDFDFSA